MNSSGPARARTSRVSLLAAALLAALGASLALLTVGRPVMAQPDPAHPEYSGYEESSRLLELDGKVVDGVRVWDHYVRAGRSRSLHSCLVTDVPGYGAFIVKRMGQRLLKVRPEDLIVCDDLSRSLKPDAVLADLGAVRIDPKTQQLGFDLPKPGNDPIRGVLKDPPMLLGWSKLEGLLESNKHFNAEIIAYTPDSDALAKLAAVGGSWRLDMYFGSWCVRCERYLPRIIATAHTQLAAQREWNSKVTTFELNFYGLPRRGRAFDADDEVKARRIREVPAGLIYKDGLLVGRIEGDDWDNPAAALYAVLSR